MKKNPQDQVSQNNTSQKDNSAKSLVRHPRALPREPGRFLDQYHTKLEKDAIDEISRVLGISSGETQELLKDDKHWQEIIRLQKKQFDAQGLDLMKRIRESVEWKRSSGSLEMMKSGVMALAILHDKIFGEPERKTGVIIGKNVQVNLKWKFTPYQGQGLKATK